MNNILTITKSIMPDLVPVFWGSGIGPKEYGLYKLSKPRKKLKGWQKELKRKRK